MVGLDIQKPIASLYNSNNVLKNMMKKKISFLIASKIQTW